MGKTWRCQKNGLLAAILAAKEQASRRSLRLQWRTFTGKIMAVRLQNSNRRNDVAPTIASSFVTFSASPNESGNLAYITSVFIGYIIQLDCSTSNASLLKKRSRRWWEINNQRKAFLDMLAWSGETDNGRLKTRKSWLWRHCRRKAVTITPITPS